MEPVQEKLIPLLLTEECDRISLAQTGTGKTAAFGVPLIQLLNSDSKEPQVLVLCPTRELCVQVARDMGDFGRYIPGIKILAVYGGAPIARQINSLRQGVHIIVATPGRLNDLLRRKAAKLTAVRHLVLDEADEMLNMGFKEEIDGILAQTPATRNTLLFSATMSKEVAAIAAKYMTDPQEIVIGRRNSGADSVCHQYYMVRAKDRYLALKRIVDVNPDIYGIIFCRTRLETQEVADKLMQDGYLADALHGDLSQAQRDLVMGKFRRRNIQMLVATDVAARGVDVSELSHVINYNLPDEISNYTHRSGRTGRAGKKGTSIAIIHQREAGKIRAIERILKKKFERCTVPSGKEICEKHLVNMIDTMMAKEIDHVEIDSLLPVISEKLASLDRQELVKRFVAKEFSRFLEYYRNAPDLNVKEVQTKEHGTKNKKESKSKRKPNGEKFTRFFLNIGKKDGMGPERLIGVINEGTRIRNIAIGKIELMRNFSFIEADSRFKDNVMHAFNQLMVNGKKVKIEVAEGKRPTYLSKSSPPWKKGAKRSNSTGPRKKRRFN